jgi:hypothetical protein
MRSKGSIHSRISKRLRSLVLGRRKQKEIEINKRVDQMRTYLMSEFESEGKARMEFNDAHYRYLP